jgi:hypothetical protein
MSAHGLGSLGRLLVDPGPCVICDADSGECTHHLYGEHFYRIGDPKEKHPTLARRTIPAPHRIEKDGRVLFTEGAPMTPEEAIAHGVPVPAQAAPRRKKGRRQRPTEIQGPKGPQEDRAHHPGDDRQA